MGNSLDKLGNLEQDMATGLTEDGKDISLKEIKKRLTQYCHAENIGVIEKIRLLMVYLISQGGIEKNTLLELMKTVDERLQAAVFNLTKLGIDIASKPSKNNVSITKQRKGEFLSHIRALDVMLMRYVPYIYPLVKNLAAGRLDEDIFPYVIPPPSDYKQKKKARQWRKNPEDYEDNRPLLIVFVLGGVTLSELRSIYQIAKGQNANLIVGGSNILTPHKFIRGISDLTQSEFIQSIHDSEGNAISDQDIVVDPDSEIDDDDNIDNGKEEQEGTVEILPQKGVLDDCVIC